jgi:hypothetical protein
MSARNSLAISDTARRFASGSIDATQSAGTASRKSRMWASLAENSTHRSAVNPVSTSVPAPR